MAKLKVKQIEDLMLTPAPTGDENVTRSIQIGANSIVPLTSVSTEIAGDATGYISGITHEGNIIKLTRTALPAADIFDTNKFEVTGGTNGGARTISILDSYVQGLFGITEGKTEAGERQYMSGLDYDEENGVFTPAYTDLPTIGNGILTIKFNNTGITATSTEIFNANQSNGSILTLAAVAGSGAAGDVVVTANEELGLTSTTVQAALVELQSEINDLDAAQLTPGSGIAISTDHEISTTVTLNYDSNDKAIQLLNKANGDVIGTVDAKAFLKDGMVNSATVVTNPEGQAEGTYIKLTFNTQDPVSQTPSHEDIFINVTSLIDIYTAGNDGIKVDGREISHKAGTVTADTQIGAVTGNTITVPVVKVDGYGHVIALTEATWTLPASTALESVSGSETDFIKVTVGEKDENKNQQITATATIGSFETNGANGLATTDAVKEYVANNASTLMHREVLNYNDNAATLTYTPVGAVAITQNGLDLNETEYSVNGKSVSFTLEVAHETSDKYVAYYMYNPNTQNPQA